MSSTESTMASTPPTPTASPARANAPVLLLAGIGILAIVFLVGGIPFLSPPAPSPNGALPSVEAGTVPETFDDPIQNLEALKSTLSKEKFLKKMYTIDRDSYHLFEKAAQYLNISKKEVEEFFFTCCDLTGEEAIFADLPPVPADFASVAYDVSVGKLYQIGLLDNGYYAQPEFYTFIDQETGVVNREYAFRPWAKPELNQWGDNGMGTYPNAQFDTLDLSDRQTFTSAIFVTNGWNIQNFVGVHLVPNHDALEHFDITISEEQTGQPYFLLGPTFPYFHRDWATRVIIEGTVKPGTPPGTYSIGFNPVAPPAELNEKWSNDHPGLYAPYGFIRPSDNYITLTIEVQA